jgi:eukaryotic-like serine/threonine-protein kinase
LPGGQAVLFTLATGTATDRWDKAQIVVHSLNSGERKVLIEGGSDGRYLHTGHLVYALGGALLAVPFDLKRLEVRGGPVPVVEGVRRTGSTTGAAQFDVSNGGSLIYIPGPTSIATSPQLYMARVDRKGAVEPLKLPPGSYQTPRVSPDGRRLTFGTDDGKEAIVWIYDLSGTSSMRRLTFGGKNRFPVWTSDGQRVAFQSDREGDVAIFWQPADGTGTAERLTKPEQATSHVPESWSPKGEYLLFAATKGSNVSLWTFSLQDKKTIPFDSVQSALPTNAVFSPDGHWVAYTSDEPSHARSSVNAAGAGLSNVYVQPFPVTGAKYQIFSNGIDNINTPLWSPDGKELFYIPRPQGLAVVSVATQPTFAFGNPVQVPRPMAFQGAAPNVQRGFDISPDGKIVGVVGTIQTERGAATAQQIHVVLNWFEELKQRVPTD